MQKIIAIILISFLLILPCRALTLDQALPKIAAYNYDNDRECMMTVTDAIKAAQTPEAKAALEDKLLATLQGECSGAGQQFICEQLSIVGTAKSVPALAQMLQNTKALGYFHFALFALERIPDPEAASAIQSSFEAFPTPPVALINAVGVKRLSGTVEKLYAQIGPDPSRAEAAITALGKIGGEKAAAGLDNVPPATLKTDRLRAAWVDAYVNCADSLVAAGRNELASAMYLKLYSAENPPQVKHAALAGLIATGHEKGIEFVTQSLASADPTLQQMAVSLVSELKGEASTRALAQQLPKLNTPAQVLLITALANRADRIALPAVTAAAMDDQPEIKLAAVKALARLGDAESLKFLANLAATARGALQAAARESLARVNDPQADETMRAGLNTAEGPLKLEYIRAAGARNLAGANEILVKLSLDPDAKIRLASLGALRTTARPAILPGLIEVYQNLADEDERQLAETVIVGVARQMPAEQKPAAGLLTALEAKPPVAIQAGLFRMLGQLGAPEALPILREALRDEEPALREAAVRGLSEWPTTEVMTDLFELADSSQEQYKLLALRGYIRLIGADPQRPLERTVTMYEESLRMAQRDEERRMALGGLAAVSHPQALQLALKYLENAELKNEAEAAAYKIATALVTKDPRPAKIALRLLAKTGAESIRRQARRQLELLELYEDYITEWQLAGPFTSDDKDKLLETPLPPETQPEAVTWKTIKAPEWFVPLDTYFGDKIQAAYLRVTITSPGRQEVLLQLGSDDGVQAWLNGKVVHTHNVQRGINPGEDEVKVTLEKGPNQLLLKVVNLAGTFSAAARFRAPDGAGLEGLSYSAE